MSIPCRRRGRQGVDGIDTAPLLRCQPNDHRQRPAPARTSPAVDGHPRPLACVPLTQRSDRRHARSSIMQNVLFMRRASLGSPSGGTVSVWSATQNKASSPPLLRPWTFKEISYVCSPAIAWGPLGGPGSGAGRGRTTCSWLASTQRHSHRQLARLTLDQGKARFTRKRRSQPLEGAL